MAVVDCVGLSDIGNVRKNNEDAWGQLEDVRFYALADGMGGHLAGEVASREAINSVVETARLSFREAHDTKAAQEIEMALKLAIEQANARVHQMGKSRQEWRGMGTTLCCLHLYNCKAVWGHVGDSRIYRLRAGDLSRLTKDHSLLSKLIDNGTITDAKSAKADVKHVVTRAVGIERTVVPSLASSDTKPGDLFILCSDGLTDAIPDTEIARIALLKESLASRAQLLVEVAKKAGGRDNITVVLVNVTDL